jgi:hypothetical protein
MSLLKTSSALTPAGVHRAGAKERSTRDILLRAFVLLLAALFFVTTLPAAQAQAAKPVTKSDTFNIGPSKGEVIGVVAGGIAAIVVITFLVYHGVHHGGSIKGCASTSPSGLQIVNDGDQLPYALTGELASIHPGQRVRVSGKKIKGDATYRKFVVEKVKNEYGPCAVKPATP